MIDVIPRGSHDNVLLRINLILKHATIQLNRNLITAHILQLYKIIKILQK